MADNSITDDEFMEAIMMSENEFKEKRQRANTRTYYHDLDSGFSFGGYKQPQKKKITRSYRVKSMLRKPIQKKKILMIEDRKPNNNTSTRGIQLK